MEGPMSNLPTNPVHQQAMADAATMCFRLAAIAQEVGSSLAALAGVAAFADPDTEFPEPTKLPPLPPESAVPPPDEASVTLAQLTQMMTKLAKQGGKPKVVALLAKHGVKKMSDLPTADYRAVMDAMTAVKMEETP